MNFYVLVKPNQFLQKSNGKMKKRNTKILLQAIACHFLLSKKNSSLQNGRTQNALKLIEWLEFGMKNWIWNIKDLTSNIFQHQKLSLGFCQKIKESKTNCSFQLWKS